MIINKKFIDAMRDLDIDNPPRKFSKTDERTLKVYEYAQRGLVDYEKKFKVKKPSKHPVGRGEAPIDVGVPDYSKSKFVEGKTISEAEEEEKLKKLKEKTKIKVGDRVRHSQYGEGTVIRTNEDAIGPEKGKLTVKFTSRNIEDKDVYPAEVILIKRKVV